MHISDEFDTILRYAGEEALRSGYPVVGPDHLMLGILRHSDNDACRFLTDSGMDTRNLKAEIDSAIFLHKSMTAGGSSDIEMTKTAQELINKAMLEASLDGMNEVKSTHLLKAISCGPDCISKMKLRKLEFKRSTWNRVSAQTFIVRRNKYSS